MGSYNLARLHLEVHNDTWDSNHFSVMPKDSKPSGENLPHWKLNKVNRKEFRSLYNKRLI